MRSHGRQRSELDSNHAAALGEIQEVIDRLIEQVALIACDGTIVAVNNRWSCQVERQSRHGLHISRDYISFLNGLVESGDKGAVHILEAFRDVAQGSRRNFHFLYNGTGAFEGYYFNVGVTALNVHGTRYVLVSVHDVTELVALKREQRRAGSRILRALQDERRRMARELHDSTSQTLISLQLNLSRLSGNKDAPELAPIVAECQQAVQEMHREIRAFSFLAHPPNLTPNNLEIALEDLVTGFAARSGLTIDLEVCNVGEVSASVEAAIYRVSQEALSNIHRHASAAHAVFRLIARENYLHLVIRDDGIGMHVDPDNPRAVGVGVIGMKERVRELGGRLSIRHAFTGTTLAVAFPRHKRLVFAPVIGAR